MGMMSLGYTPAQLLESARERVAYFDQDGVQKKEPLLEACKQAKKVSDTFAGTLKNCKSPEQLKSHEELAGKVLNSLKGVQNMTSMAAAQITKEMEFFTPQKKKECDKVRKSLDRAAENLKESLEVFKASVVAVKDLEWVVVSSAEEAAVGAEMATKSS